MKKIVYLTFTICLIVSILTGCEGEIIKNQTNSTKSEKAQVNEKLESKETKETQVDEKLPRETDGKYAKIKFSEMYETKNNVKNVSAAYKSLDGKNVSLTGYMAVQSPLDESFIYLVNQPYVSCPFCTIGDITKLEIIPVYMANGSKIKYSENGVTIRGRLEVEEKTDSLQYVTQFRIYADEIVNVTDENVDKELQEYYATLSKAGMIIDIQTLQMNIEYATNETYMNDYYGTTKSEIVTNIVGEYTDMIDYLEYIKECPLIVKQCEPTAKRLIKLNNEFIEIYNDQIKVLEKFAAIIGKGQIEGITDAEKEKLYKDFTNLNAENLKLYERFNAWNNKLRE